MGECYFEYLSLVIFATEFPQGGSSVLPDTDTYPQEIIPHVTKGTDNVDIKGDLSSRHFVLYCCEAKLFESCRENVTGPDPVREIKSIGGCSFIDIVELVEGRRELQSSTDTFLVGHPALRHRKGISRGFHTGRGPPQST